MPALFENTVIYLIGYPGVGKYTIAKEIAGQSNFILMDSHLINNPVLSIVGADGKTPLPDGVWSNIEKIRNVVLDTLEHIAPRHLNYVLTNAVMNTDEDRAIFNKILNTFQRRGSKVIPVFLHCDRDEHKRRIISDERRKNFKTIDPGNPDKCDKTGLLQLPDMNTLTVDVTSTSAEQAAQLILEKSSEFFKKEPLASLQRTPL